MADSNTDKGYAWCILPLALTSMTLGCLGLGSSGVYFIEIRRDLQISSQTTSWIGVLQITLIGFTTLFLGPLVKIHGPRLFVMIGSLITTSCLVLATFWGRNLVFLFITYGCFMGVGMGFQQIGALAAVQIYFIKRRGLALGVVMCGPGLAALVWAPLCAWLIKLFSWRGSLTILACIQLHGVAIGALLLPTLTHKHTPGGDVSVAPPRDGCVQRTGIYYLARPVYLMYLLGILLAHTGHITPFLFLTNFGVSMGTDEQEAATLMSAMGICSVLARSSLSAIFDIKTIRPYRTLLCGISIIITGCLTLSASFIKQFYILYLYGAAFGLITSCYVVLQFATPTDFYGDKDSAVFSGHVLFFVGSATLISGPLGGRLLDTSGNAAMPFLITGLIQIAGGFLVLASSVIIKVKQKRQPENIEETSKEKRIPPLST